ncbi:hypothetical protein ASPSYDRAFT_144025 [Aspergillus sydowii CBS 593.65]|uniref:Zn(II)2Cys6 transcription factor n=1 Tax=Aspergillus sydowii CBS 593.65 TaxID=1036612 RepID=A0A1L9TS86_9EURO|nr:uncharacterized protein ASPSYDRAFT_144025 [Aspergillus sydowii CBS 593.65]OJJ62294.1 hypothetical protein ASPSYDRAFT_144025 [Aspergillus sydowii CBS 593.65]
MAVWSARPGESSRNRACEYIPPTSSLPWRPKIKSRSSTPSLPPSAKASPSAVDPAFLAQYEDFMETSLAVSPAKELNIEDLELMVQWCTKTYRSVSRNGTVESIWQAVVPREAMRHPFLMHGILALSALHLAVASDDDLRDQYIEVSKAHQRQAVVGLGKISGKLKPHHYNAAFTLSNIMMIFSFALPEITGQTVSQSPVDEIHRVFQSTRKSRDVLTNVTDCVGNGELKMLLEYDTAQPKMPDTSRLAIMSLAQLNTNLARKDPHHEKDIYDTTIKHLGHSLDKVSRGGETMIVAFQWIFQVPARYMELFRKREPFALVILAHYAVIMHFLRRHWWMGEWSLRLIQEIGQHLDPNWRNSITWVLDATSYYIPPV